MTIITQWLPLSTYLIELVIKIIALGTIPRNRRPSSSLAWLLLIVVTPVLGLILFFLIGSPFVRGRRERIQVEANEVIIERTADLPELPSSSELPARLDKLGQLKRPHRSPPILTAT